jgi:N-methylhydantoinase B/oxoprolinase/acetone carboxylase alpha subunit
MRDAIRAVPDSTYTCELMCDELDGAYPLRVAITIQGDEVLVDFAGTAPQQPRGGVNSTFTYTQAHAAYALKCALLPDVPSNEGCYKPFRIVAPAGSVLNCTRPTSVMNRTKTGWYIAPLIFGALAPVIPNQVMASCGLMTAMNAYGVSADGQAFNASLFNAGGMGAGQNSDGTATTIFPSSASNVPVELFETAVPLVVWEKELVPDSGGAGMQRGGLGQRITVGRLPNYQGSLIVSVSPHRQVFAPEGLLGGERGSPARVAVDGRYLTRDEITQQTGALHLTSDETRVSMETAGGGGFGAPHERPREAIERDARDGLVTEETMTTKDSQTTHGLCCCL